MADVSLWGGPECTVRRIGEGWSDQIRRTGHHDRETDLALFAGLGLSRLRYPMLWERTEVEPGKFDWRWSDRRLAEARRLDLGIVAGLVHHGSGPAWTHLLDDGFATGLARFAGAAARRYPWVRDWTPVNEPLTTARFSALYGLWHPHLRDEGALWRALLNQIEAIVQSMTEIRRVIPDARLIQTEDFGRTYGTEPCRSQVDFENGRRRLSWDLLCGRVDRAHPLWPRLAATGLIDRLQALADAPCVPDVLGVNHYVTSDRFLDHRIERYPPAVRGGNDTMAYADVEAVRVLPAGIGGWDAVLAEVWDRYRLPLAVTECHLGGPAEDQCRWLLECWRAARSLNARGGRVEAVTVWSLLGAFDWDSLLTRNAGHYEPGAFDVSTGVPVPTALAHFTRSLAKVGAHEPPGTGARPWWRDDARILYPVGEARHADREDQWAATALACAGV